MIVAFTAIPIMPAHTTTRLMRLGWLVCAISVLMLSVADSDLGLNHEMRAKEVENV
jgi:hypothetical protein